MCEHKPPGGLCRKGGDLVGQAKGFLLGGWRPQNLWATKMPRPTILQASKDEICVFYQRRSSFIVLPWLSHATVLAFPVLSQLVIKTIDVWLPRSTPPRFSLLRHSRSVTPFNLSGFNKCMIAALWLMAGEDVRMWIESLMRRSQSSPKLGGAWTR